jgi:hypothetical protein
LLKKDFLAFIIDAIPVVKKIKNNFPKKIFHSGRTRYPSKRIRPIIRTPIKRLDFKNFLSFNNKNKK